MQRDSPPSQLEMQLDGSPGQMGARNLLRHITQN